MKAPANPTRFFASLNFSTPAELGESVSKELSLRVLRFFPAVAQPVRKSLVMFNEGENMNAQNDSAPIIPAVNSDAEVFEAEQSELSYNGIHGDVQRALILALAKSVRKFRKCPCFSVAWRAALRKLQQENPKDYRNGLDYADQLLKEIVKALRQASKNTVELGRLFQAVGHEGQSICTVEEDLRRLACCSEPEHEGIDPAWDAVYDQILLGPSESGRPQPLTRSFDQLLQCRGLNLRREIAAFLQSEFPSQIARDCEGYPIYAQIGAMFLLVACALGLSFEWRAQLHHNYASISAPIAIVLLIVIFLGLGYDWQYKSTDEICNRNKQKGVRKGKALAFFDIEQH